MTKAQKAAAKAIKDIATHRLNNPYIQVYHQLDMQQILRLVAELLK